MIFTEPHVKMSQKALETLCLTNPDKTSGTAGQKRRNRTSRRRIQIGVDEKRKVKRPCAAF